MYDLRQALNTSQLFKGLSEREISDMLVRIKYKIPSFSKNQVIALEGEDTTSIGIILEGHIEAQKSFPSGRNVTINRMKQGDVFGEATVFSEAGQYPATIVSVTQSKIMFIPKHDIISLCGSNRTFLTNFMGLLSGKILMLNNRLKSLSHQTIRQKIADHLIEEYKRKGGPSIHIPYSREEMAQHFGTTRPSLSRELSSMRDDGLIAFDRRTILIKDLNSLEDILF